MEVSYLYNYFHRCLPFPKVHTNETNLSFQQDQAALGRLWAAFSSMCRFNRMESQEHLRGQNTALRSSVLLVTLLCIRQSHSSKLYLK